MKRWLITAMTLLGGTLDASAAQAPTDSVVARAGRSRSKGAAAAPVTLVEISDFQCPFCRQFAQQTLGQLDSAYVRTGKVRMVFINLPMPMHSRSWTAAEAALCAGAQGAFWPMHDRLFAEQEQWSRTGQTSEHFVRYAGALRLDAVAFRRCLDEDQVAPILVNDILQVGRNNVTGTPTFVLNESEVFSGAVPFGELRAKIEAALSGAAGGRPPVKP